MLRSASGAGPGRRRRFRPRSALGLAGPSSRSVLVLPRQLSWRPPGRPLPAATGQRPPCQSLPSLGPWTVPGRRPRHRHAPTQVPSPARATAAAFEQAGNRFLPDQNGVWQDGYFPVSISNQNEQRASAATGYLDRTTRSRTNLTISTDTTVRALLFDGPTCVGVRATVGGRSVEYRGREVILSTGAIHTPAHLLRAGIGPAGELRALGIDIARQFAGSRRSADGPSVDRARLLHQTPGEDGRPNAAAYPCGDALFVRPAGRAGRGHVRRLRQQVRLACGGRADRLADPVREQDLFRGGAGAVCLVRSRRRTGGGVQPAVRQPRRGAADGRVPPPGRAAISDIALGHYRPVPGQL